MEMKLSENIRAYRRERRMTQEQLAEVLGVTVGAVHKWESGLSVPDIALIMEMADFFETSVDVLLGYERQNNSVEAVSKRIKTLRNQKDFDAAIREAEKALKKYPNSFRVIYQSADLYHMYGIEGGGKRNLNRAIELFERACMWIEQNDDPQISALTIKNDIAEIQLLLGKTEMALETLKKNNFGGINNNMIGMILAQECHRAEEALPYLSRALGNLGAELIRVCFGYANAYSDLGRLDDALEILQWLNTVMDGLRVDGQVSFVDKVKVSLYAACAQLEASRGESARVKELLRIAKREADRFDAAPSYGMNGVRYVHTETEGAAFDDMGKTAHDVIRNAITSGGEKETALMQACWDELCRKEA